MSDEIIKKNNIGKEFTKGIFRQNPVFIILLGLCPTLAVTSMVSTGIGMGIAVTIVLIGSNVLISLLKDFIPEKIRIPAYIVIIAVFVTIIDLLLKAYFPFLSHSLGIYISLIVVNCIILGRAEAFANKNKVSESIMDALGMGLGFTLALLIISIIRELLGKCYFDFSGLFKDNNFKLALPFVDTESSKVIIKLFGNEFEVFSGMSIITLPAGAFFIIGLILALINYIKIKKAGKEIKWI